MRASVTEFNFRSHRREQARNPAYVDLDVRLQELIERRNDANADIEQILLDLENLYKDVDEVGNLPHRMGFEDRGRYDLFLDIKHAVGAVFDEAKALQFVDVLVGGLMKGLYAGWQESELKRNDVVTDIKTLGDDDDFASLGAPLLSHPSSTYRCRAACTRSP